MARISDIRVPLIFVLFLQCERLNLEVHVCSLSRYSPLSSAQHGRKEKSREPQAGSCSSSTLLLRSPLSQAVSFAPVSMGNSCMKFRLWHTCLEVRRKQHLQVLLLCIQTSDKWSSTTQLLLKKRHHQLHTVNIVPTSYCPGDNEQALVPEVLL